MKTNEEIVQEFRAMRPKLCSVSVIEIDEAYNWLRTTLEAKDKVHQEEIEKAVIEERERMFSAIEDYFIGSYPIPDAKILCGYIRQALTPTTDKQ